MAGKGFPISILSLAILVLLATSQQRAADALNLNGVVVTSLQVTGRVCCSSTGNAAPGTPGLAGARVLLLYNGGQITDGVTNLNGDIRLIVNDISVLNRIVNPNLLKIRVILPVSTCPVLSTVNGALECTLTPVGAVIGGLVSFALNTLTVVA